MGTQELAKWLKAIRDSKTKERLKEATKGDKDPAAHRSILRATVRTGLVVKVRGGDKMKQVEYHLTEDGEKLLGMLEGGKVKAKAKPKAKAKVAKKADPAPAPEPAKEK